MSTAEKEEADHCRVIPCVPFNTSSSRRTSMNQFDNRPGVDKGMPNIMETKVSGGYGVKDDNSTPESNVDFGRSNPKK